MKIITFLSDFGVGDWFVAAVKGEILKIAPTARIVDITHNIRPYDVQGAAFVLSAVYRDFPRGSIHLSVVDPGVGGGRKPIIVQSQGHSFVGPDNGIFSRIYDKSSIVYEIKIDVKTSITFHARDIFGPTAARLAKGTSASRLGKIQKAYVAHQTKAPVRRKSVIFGEIAYVDHFGNCITNIPNRAEVTRLVVLGRVIDIADHYSARPHKRLVGVKGSLGYYEIARYEGSSNQVLKAGPGTPVKGYL